MEKTIRDYENTVQMMKKQNEDLADAYDKKIEEIDKENKKLQKRIDDRIELYNHQKDEIYEKTAKVDNLGVEIQRQKDLFNERNIMNRNKFDELQNKYKFLISSSLFFLFFSILFSDIFFLLSFLNFSFSLIF